MQSVLIIQCFICKVSLRAPFHAKPPNFCDFCDEKSILLEKDCYFLRERELVLFSVLYAKFPYYVLLYIAKCPYYTELCMQSVLIMLGFICTVSFLVLCWALHAKCPYYAELCMQSVLVAWA